MRVFLLPVFVFATLSVAASGAPGEISAHSFYAVAKELADKGMGAMFDKRTKPMIAHMKAAGKTVKTENEAATKRGRPIYCVPDSARKKGAGPKFVLEGLEAIPERRRRQLTVTQAWREILVRKYPCG